MFSLGLFLWSMAVCVCLCVEVLEVLQFWKQQTPVHNLGIAYVDTVDEGGDHYPQTLTLSISIFHL
jgi:hypothetical protein